MVKKMLILVTGVMVIGGLSACTGSTVNTERSEVNDVAGAEKTTDVADITTISSAEYPDTYYITYEVETGDGIVREITKAVDDDGNIYYKNEDEYLFKKEENDYYSLYEKEEDTFTVKDTQYTEEYVDEFTEEFDQYAKKADVDLWNSFTYAGQDTVLDKTCDVYEAVVTVVNFKQVYQLVIDHDSHICMSWNSMQNVSGYEQDGGEDSFSCIRFDTEEIDLEQMYLKRL